MDGHVLLEAGEGAFFFHGGEVLGLEVDDALLLAEAVHVEEVFGCREELVCFEASHGVHY